MAKSKSWSVKGIDNETRDLARGAAQAAGMTIGAWIDQAILKAKHDELPELANPVITTPAGSGATPVKSDEIGTGTQIIPVETADPSPPESNPGATAEAQSDKQKTDTPAEVIPDADRAQSISKNASEEPRVTDATDSYAVESYANAGVAEPQPLPPRPARTSPARYAVLGIVLLAIIAGGGWLFTEFSQREQTSSPERSAGLQTPPTDGPTPAAPGKTAPALSDAIQAEIDLARAGDAKTQYSLGMRHLAGRVVKKDSTEAAKWFERAAVQGLADAQFNLGVLYQRGEGVAQDDRLAFFWYQSAADQGMPRAQHNLATAYAEGKGISKSYPKALEWFTKSANAGVGASQYSLAAIYESGLVTGKPDLAQARLWYEKAAAQGDTKATERLALMRVVPAKDQIAPTGAKARAPVADTIALKAVGRQEIREIQSLLARMNFNPGPADGQMGGKTADAIRLYQQFAGIEIDGVPSAELLEEMRAVAASMSGGG
jgi:TPR repeat protein